MSNNPTTKIKFVRFSKLISWSSVLNLIERLKIESIGFNSGIDMDMITKLCSYKFVKELTLKFWYSNPLSLQLQSS